LELPESVGKMKFIIRTRGLCAIVHGLEAIFLVLFKKREREMDRETFHLEISEGCALPENLTNDGCGRSCGLITASL
jgi:hypothetical protein